MIWKRAKHIISGILIWQGTIWGLAVIRHFWVLDQWLESYPAFKIPSIITLTFLLVAGSFFGVVKVYLGIYGDEEEL